MPSGRNHLRTSDCLKRKFLASGLSVSENGFDAPGHRRPLSAVPINAAVLTCPHSSCAAKGLGNQSAYPTGEGAEDLKSIPNRVSNNMQSGGKKVSLSDLIISGPVVRASNRLQRMPVTR